MAVKYTVWVGGTDTGTYNSENLAEQVADEWKEEGYLDVEIDEWEEKDVETN